MSEGNQVDIRARFYELLTRRVVYHGLAWLALLILLINFEGIGQSWWFTLSNELINLLFYALIVYFNLYYLVPNYLTKSRLATYIGLLILATLVVTPLKVIVFYLKFHNYHTLQAELLHNLNGFFLSTFLVASASTVFKIMTEWFRQQRVKQELETQTMQSELRFLKSQINPHFLFNTLNNLYALTLKKSDKAPEIVIKLSEMMRYMLYECNEKRVPLRKEIHYLQNYLDLERLRQHQSVQINLTVNGHIGDQQIAPLLFIPFLENSFKHGLNAQISQGFVNMTLEVDQQYMRFFIENSKSDVLPMRPDSGRPSGGIGLVNVRRRLDLMYPDRYELSINDTPQTYAVTLELELI